MKKIFTLIAAALMGMTASAQQVWDFTVVPTQVCDGTGNVVTNGAGGIVATNPDSWGIIYNKAGIADGTEFTASEGVVFEPTKGLKWGVLDNEKMVIYRNYPASYGGSYLFINKACDVTIPAKKGQIIEFIAGTAKNNKKITAYDDIDNGKSIDPEVVTIDGTTIYDYQSYTFTALYDNPTISMENNICIQKITVKDGGAAEQGQKWDFTKWSDATVAALQADAAAGTTGWSNDEKNNGNTVEGCYWCAAETNADGTISANGVVIEELKGLVFDTDYTQMRSLAIATNYPSTSLGTYQGPQYLWLGSKGKKCFTIPNVTAGSEITFEMESHKPAEARGIQLKQGGTQIGSDFKPTTFASQTFTIENAGDVEVWNTNGCHIYTITVTDGTNGIGEVKTVRVANNAIYNLAGQRIAAPVKGQIYIQNGKKYMAK